MDLVKQNEESLDSKIVFDVSGTLFSTTKDTLLRIEDSYFTSLLASGHWKPQKDGTYFIDRSPKCFALILDYMRYGVLDIESLTPELKEMVQADFDYFFPNPKIEGLLGLEREYVMTMQKWLVNLNITRLKVLWRGTRDGLTAQEFHSRCDNMGPTLTVVESQEGWIFGGYNPVHWQSPTKGCYSNAPDAFLFTLKNPQGSPPTSYHCAFPSCTIYHNAAYGPSFGGDDLTLLDGNQSYIHFPTYYTDTTGLKNTTFTGSRWLDVKEVEVYAIS